MIGASGLALTTTSEGLFVKPYKDPVGIPTVCYGHTGPDVTMGRTPYTVPACKAILMSDIAAHQAYILPGREGNCIGDIGLNQNQIDALTDFVFNIGGPKFCSSHMARYLALGDFKRARYEFHRWTYGMIAGKPVQLPGLIKRRQAEQILFDTPVPRALPSVAGGAQIVVTGTSRKPAAPQRSKP